MHNYQAQFWVSKVQLHYDLNSTGLSKPKAPASFTGKQVQPKFHIWSDLVMWAQDYFRHYSERCKVGRVKMMT